MVRDIAGRECLWARLCPATIGSGEIIIFIVRGKQNQIFASGSGRVRNHRDTLETCRQSYEIVGGVVGQVGML